MDHDYRGSNNISIPIIAVIPIMLSPSPRENGKMSICRPHSRGITVVRNYRGYRGFPGVIITVSSSTGKQTTVLLYVFCFVV